MLFSFQELFRVSSVLFSSLEHFVLRVGYGTVYFALITSGGHFLES